VETDESPSEAPAEEPQAPERGVDAVLLALAAAFAAAVAILGPRGEGRVLELLITAGAALLSYRVGWRAARAVGGAAVAAFLLLEAHFGRLGHGHTGRELLTAILVVGACLLAARARRDVERLRYALRAARDDLAHAQASAVLEQKLSGSRRAGALEYELERSRRHNHEVSLLLVRPDGFDELAMRFGDEVANEALGIVAEAIGANLRATDVPLRLGSFDFGVILPETAAETARVVGERIRLDVSGRRLGLAGEGDVELTVAGGVATFPNDAKSNEELVAAAQRALSQAAERGGNRTVVTSLPADAPPGWRIS